MKRFLKFILIFIIITSGIWIIFDDYIVRYLIIQETEKFTNKKVTLDDVNLYYFPNLKIELINLKDPNPDQDHIIIKSKQILIDIDLEQLLKKKLIINEINSNSTKFFDTSEKTERIENKEGNKKPNAKIKKDQKEILNSFLKLPPDIFQTSQIVSNLTETLTFDEEHTEINQIINKSNEILVNKKDKIINLSNTSLYEINSLSVNSITSVDDLKFTEKKLNEINDNLQLLKSEAYNLKELYYKTLSQVNEIKASMNLKIDNAFSFSVNSEKSKNDNHNESINLAIYIKNKLKEVSFNKKKPPGKKSFKGITYQFSKDTYPTFLLKKIEINTAESNDYLKGVNLTFDRKFRNKSKIYFKQMNKPNYEKIIFFANGTA
ncbi:MAG: hypothetical protein VW397_06505, partial [Candidatus Margulisiibacteriota bacterium]